MNIEDYRNAPSGIGPLAHEWADKPHRLVYDLCRSLEATRELVAKLAEVTFEEFGDGGGHDMGLWLDCGDLSESEYELIRSFLDKP